MEENPRERWQRLSAILDEVLALSGDLRAAHIDRVCEGDDALREELEKLFAAAGQPDFLDSPAFDYAAPLIAASGRAAEPDPAHERIGPYHTIRELARGGMGAVYLARRVDGQFEQVVAVKLIRRGLDSDEVQRRFLAERQILARLNHPHIARLLDGGVTQDGLPWFAMEYVEGTRIDEHCDARRLDLEQRLALFEDVCAAVRYAHQNLVVHRDLKPSNILVSPDGRATLLDFGIAKLLQSASHDETLTRIDAPLMTPAYAAPEQVRGEPVTTATDVYALGAVLYELLSGQRAHRFGVHSPAEMERVVCEVEPPLPSAAVAPEPETSHTRDTVPERLRRQLRGDLDTIICTALQKDPALRYPTVDALLEEIRRYRAGQPIRARPVSRMYRVAKFVRRHRVGFAATVALVVSLLAGLAGTIWQARSASLHASRAQREAAKAIEVRDFVVGLFEAADPAQSQGRDITARELVNRGTHRMDTALATQPDVKVALLHVLGEINRELGFFAHADTLFGRAAELARDVFGEGSTELADELMARGGILWARGDYQVADSALRAALDTYRARLGAIHPKVADALGDLATVHAAKGEYAEAEPLYRGALDIKRRTLGDAHLETAETLNDLGVLLWRANRLEAADSAARAALDIKRELLPAGHPSILISQHNIALNLLNMGRLGEAERLEREVLAGRRRLYPGGHPDIAIALQQLAAIAEAQGRYEQAESFLVEAITLRRGWLGDDHPETITLINNLAVLNYRMGNFSRAESMTREALAHLRRTLGDDHPTTLATSNNLGVILSDAGRYGAAETLLRDVLNRRRERLGDGHEQVAQTLRNLGILLHRTRRYDEAEATIRRALDVYRAALPAGHVRTAEAATALGELLVDRARPAPALPLLQEALAIRRDAHGARDGRTAETLRILGECLAALGRYEEAEAHLLEGLRTFDDNGQRNRERVRTLRALVALYEKQGDRLQASTYRRLVTGTR